MGDGDCDKSAILKRYDESNNNRNELGTIGLDFIKSNYTASDGSTIPVKVFDTAGQERFRSLTNSFFRQADGVIIAFDLTSDEAYKQIGSWFESIQSIRGTQVPKILVGSKVDRSDERVVDKETALKMANEFGVNFHEVSAVTGVGI